MRWFTSLKPYVAPPMAALVVLGSGVVLSARPVTRPANPSISPVVAAPVTLSRMPTVVRRVPVPDSAAEPVRAGMSTRYIGRAEAAVRAEHRRGAFPGAAIVVGRGTETVLKDGIGKVGWGPNAEPVDPDATVYDLASLTKVVATTTAVMLLVEDGRLSLDARVAEYLPEFSIGDKASVTIRDLLKHTSGLPAGADVFGPTAEASLTRAIRTPLERARGSKEVYSDIGFIVLWAAAERAAGEPLYRLLDRRVYAPLGMRSTTFLPGEGCPTCAPTVRLADGTAVRGLVHDPVARTLGGIAGSAGLFGTAADLSRFAAMLANEGELDGVRVLRAETIRQFGKRQPGAGSRALGWDTPSPRRNAPASALSSRAYGHTGFTGTSLWIDPERRTWAVILTNRVYAPKATNQIQALRRKVNDRIAAAVDSAPAVIRVAE